MKKIVICVCLLLAVGRISAEDIKKDSLLTKFETFVGQLEKKQDTQTKIEMTTYKLEYEKISAAYKKYKKDMTNDDVQKYNELNGRYKKFVVNNKFNKVGDSMERAGSKISGAVQGIFGSKKSNTTSK